MIREDKTKWIVFGSIVLLLCGILFFIIGFWDSSLEEQEGSVSQSELHTIEYEGKTYRYNNNLTNILFLGIDNDSKMEEYDAPRNSGQSDCIMLLTLNKETKECQILQIPRDTMVDVDLFDMSGNYYNSVNRQIATQFAYGFGGKDSCWITQKKVSELLNDLQIDAYIGMDMASISMIVDAIGGVSITIPEDYTQIDLAFQKGATVVLDGNLAERYVRGRQTDVMFSNNQRMERQLQFIPAFIDSVKAKVGENVNYYEWLYPVVEDYVVTNMSESQMNELSEYQLAESKVQTLPGEGKMGKTYEEFHVDLEKLDKMLIEMFYISKE